MATCKGVGKVEVVPYEIKYIEWRIPDFFGDQTDYIYESPTFCTKDASWYLHLWPWNSNHESMLINIWNDATVEYSLGYCFGLKKCDGTIEELVCGTMKKQSSCSNWESLIKKTELFRRKTELLPSDILIVICTMKWETALSQLDEQTEFHRKKPLKLISKS